MFTKLYSLALVAFYKTEEGTKFKLAATLYKAESSEEATDYGHEHVRELFPNCDTYYVATGEHLLTVEATQKLCFSV